MRQKSFPKIVILPVCVTHFDFFGSVRQKNRSKFLIIPLLDKFFWYQKLSETPKGTPSRIFSLTISFRYLFCDTFLYGLPKKFAPDKWSTPQLFKNTKNFSNRKNRVEIEVPPLPIVWSFSKHQRVHLRNFRYCGTKKFLRKSWYLPYA